MHIDALETQLWTLPLHAPFAISQRTAYEAFNVIVSVHARERGAQLTGYGACAPVAYVTGETTATVMSALDSTREALVGAPADRLGPMLALLSEILPASPAARACLEIAVYDLWAKIHRISLWHYFGACQTELTTDITIPINTPEEAGRLAAEAVRNGFSTLKIKVGAHEGPGADLLRLKAIADAAPGIRVRIDANQAFTPPAAVSFARRLPDFSMVIDLIEQPVAKEDFAGLKYVKDAIDYPVFADEAACSAASVIELIKRDAVDGINIKLMKSGISGALEIIGLCRAAGKDLMIGCMLETGIGIAAAAQIAAGTGAFRHIDLDSHLLLAPVPEIAGGFVASGDTLTVSPLSDLAYGWGVEVAERVAG